MCWGWLFWSPRSTQTPCAPVCLSWPHHVVWKGSSLFSRPFSFLWCLCANKIVSKKKTIVFFLSLTGPPPPPFSGRPGCGPRWPPGRPCRGGSGTEGRGGKKGVRNDPHPFGSSLTPPKHPQTRTRTSTTDPGPLAAGRTRTTMSSLNRSSAVVATAVRERDAASLFTTSHPSIWPAAATAAACAEAGAVPAMLRGARSG